ncbi:hypothetical protein N7471_002560 [Penicillium samsonianum]|uniref:uncharacterized protein n=1 Tax=Penicillium samsonianum TaxID=1882272 RepID=UPI002548E4EA|nr:uncharacterized protein N7471_002560 [Penicillium samsonianum]KAJ6143107.1 hypothetical protein N7471_002560 [Penicillium samsonianum]
MLIGDIQILNKKPNWWAEFRHPLDARFRHYHASSAAVSGGAPQSSSNAELPGQRAERMICSENMHATAPQTKSSSCRPSAA